MSTASASAVGLLTELVRHGIELQAHGDRLRYRPRSALTPDLAERVKAHKPALLALLRDGRALQPAQDRQNPPVSSAARRSGTIGRPEVPQATRTPDPPHELSLTERVESGYVNRGWTPKAWADRLRVLADRCEARRPELAATYRTWAANVQKNEKNMRSAY